LDQGDHAPQSQSWPWSQKVKLVPLDPTKNTSISCWTMSKTLPY